MNEIIQHIDSARNSDSDVQERQPGGQGLASVSVPEPAVINSADGLRTICVVDDPDAETTSPEAVFAAATRYVAAGLSVIPIDAELGSKSPDVCSWKIYQFRLPRVDELQEWYDRGRQFGLAVVAGAVSGGRRSCGLEVIDFDTIELAE